MYMISLFYVIIQYEQNNELIILLDKWNNKIKFYKFNFKDFNNIFFNSINFNYFNCSLSLDKGRSYFRTSNIDLFSSILLNQKNL